MSDQLRTVLRALALEKHEASLRAAIAQIEREVEQHGTVDGSPTDRNAMREVIAQYRADPERLILDLVPLAIRLRAANARGEG